MEPSESEAAPVSVVELVGKVTDWFAPALTVGRLLAVAILKSEDTGTLCLDNPPPS